MARILAIDYGTKRVGLAVTDVLGMIANPLETVETKNIFIYLQNYCKTEEVDCFVLGEPKRLDNTDSSVAGQVKKFKLALEKLFPEKKVYMYDERFTSQMAFQAMIDGGLKKNARRDKSLTDRISAAIILQSFLEYRSNIQQ
jgi:putative Holliday junction resolvase